MNQTPDTPTTTTDSAIKRYPLLPLRDVVVFPHTVLPLFVGRKRSIIGLEHAMKMGGHVVLAAQKNAKTDDPNQDDIHTIACLAKVLQLLKLPDGTVKVLVEGVSRVDLSALHDDGTLLTCEITPRQTKRDQAEDLTPFKRTLIDLFEQYVKQQKKIPAEVTASLTSMDDLERLVDTVVAHLAIAVEAKQTALALSVLSERYEHALSLIETELDIAQTEKKIRNRVKRQIEKNQRDHYLNEQVKAIQKELGDGDDDAYIEELEKKIKTAGMSKEALKKAESELKKLKMMPPMSSESSVSRNYLDVMVALPWKKKSKINLDLNVAQATLDADHNGLEKVKERIVEYLAVQQRVAKVKSPILCLVGPPGVGKTSLGQSIAKATGRKYVRMALGGVRDEAEIRGHRRTYIGALPGKILQNLSKTGVRNPLFLLDEIDKMGGDHRGDPASALLEVLDPEQNHSFQDHYLESDFDLSDVMFVATSNSLNIPHALLDRMEIIRLSGYTEDEKVHIGLEHLLPKQMALNGLLPGELKIEESAVRDIVRYFTREAGVRSLERDIGKVCRKVVKKAVLANGTVIDTKKPSSVKTTDTAILCTVVDASTLESYLGVKKFSFGVAENANQVGQVTGLAWTEVGGEMLTIEAVVMNGKGVVVRTGSLGKVMNESVDAARSVVRARAQALGIADELFEKKDLHIHAPEGATPKDGPSAGIAMTTAMVSALTGIPVRADVAMTGEITLRGEVLAIGGLKEKLLAALRGGIKTVLIPHENAKDLIEIPANVKAGLTIVPVKWIDEVLSIALESKPVPLVQSPVLPAAIDDVKLSADASTRQAQGMGLSGKGSAQKAIKPIAPKASNRTKKRSELQ